MKLKLSELMTLSEKYSDELDLILLNDIYLTDKDKYIELKAGTQFNPTYYDLYKAKNLNEIDIRYDEKLLAKLISNFPESYRQPDGRKSVIELDRIVDYLEAMNMSSKRKRNIVAACEIYKVGQNGYDEPVIFYGEKLDKIRWNQVKVRLNRNTLIDYKVDEHGILIYYPLTGGDPNYAQKFIQFTELVSMIVESKKNGIILYPDFNPNTDVFTANNRMELLKVYNDNRPTLVVVGGELDEECKNALIQLKQFDKYAKMILVKSPEPQKRTATLQEIKKVYGRKLWEEETS
ncbi:MAG: hypothetical protein N2258_07910 [Brevinematales bacterium]|nr:hypothetical protein [Brevinematales bacterium]